jgi:N-acetylglucosaminyldiphosphoundecaprenol N-acetyl-beta-D-mannosaminyltransferase
MNMLGLDVADIDLAAAGDAVLWRSEQRGFGYVVTPNADHFARLGRTPALLPVYRGAFLRLLDSRLLALLAGRLGLPAPHVVTGSDLAPLLLRRAAGIVTILGMEAAEVARLEQKFSDLSFRHLPLPMGVRDSDPAFAAAVAFASTARTSLTFIALGSPLQEILAAAIGATPGNQGVALCVGSALAFCAGSKTRAPPAFRRRGLEWLYRLVQEPRRLAFRYLVKDPPVLLRLAGVAIRQKRQRSRPDRPPPDSPATSAAGGPCQPGSRVRPRGIPPTAQPF